MNLPLCPVCGVEIQKKEWSPKYCSRQCALEAGRISIAKRRDNRDAILARFVAQYIPEPNTGCWLWTGTAGPKGYGLIFYKTRQKTAHRVAWWLFRGEIPKPLWVLHRCDTPACCNPDHLYLGTQSQNARDAYHRGGHRPPPQLGEMAFKSKLTADKVREIRRLYAAKVAGQKRLAKQFGVKQASVSAIVNNRSWKHI